VKIGNRAVTWKQSVVDDRKAIHNVCMDGLPALELIRAVISRHPYADAHKLIEDILFLMDIAPYPSRGRDSTHDGMLCLMEVLGRVLARRGIATADVAARLTFAKSDPKRSLNQALFTRVGSSLRGEVP
jgi:hypothetical protein